jgi:hypothetical protein
MKLLRQQSRGGVPMKSIAEIAGNFITKITEAIDFNVNGLKGITEAVEPIVHEAALSAIQILLDQLDEQIYKESKRGNEWTVVRKGDAKEIVTIFGRLKYRRRYYRNKATGQMAHLLDGWLQIDAWQKVGDDVRERLVNEAVEISYQKSGEKAAPVVVSKTSVGKYISQTPTVGLISDGKKRKCAVIYVEADEDHVSMQYGGTRQAKLVYVHEGNVSETGRQKLGHVRYMSWTGTGNTDDQWEKVATYIEEQYDTDVLETVWLCGDGAAWIEAGAEWLPHCRMVLDGYHINKAFMRLTSHATQYRGWGWQILRGGTYEQLEALCAELCKHAGSGNLAKEKRVLSKYLLNHWRSIIVRRSGAPGCSAEGHVSHILSARLSSRPIGWAEPNLEKMAGLRVMRANGLPIICKKSRPSDVTPYLPEAESVRQAAKQVRKGTDDWNVQLPIFQLGKSSYLLDALKGLAYGLSS